MDPGKNSDKLSPEEKAAWDATTKALASHQTRCEDLLRRIAGVGLLVCTLTIVVGLYTFGWMCAKTISGGPADSSWGSVAVTKSCDELGPISRFGIGTWWDCVADVHSPSGGPPSKREFNGSELTPADIGKPVDVTTVSGARPGDSPSWERDTTRPWAFVPWVLVFAGWLPVAYLFLHGCSRVAPLRIHVNVDKDAYRKYYAKYVREGRLSPQDTLDLTPPRKKEDEPPPPPPPGVPVDPPPPAPHQAGTGQQPPASFGNQPGRGW